MGENVSKYSLMLAHISICLGRMKILLNWSSSVITFVEILIMYYINVFRITYLWIVCISQDGKKKTKSYVIVAFVDS